MNIDAPEALRRLQEGNRRFARGEGHASNLCQTDRRQALTDSQKPFAIILGCSDSRVPAEIIFDQGLGDLFVIRVAGNIVAPSQIGSIEFAAERFGTPLVVVLGHSRCGAICATLEELERPAESRSPNLSSIVDRIRPAVEVLLDTELRTDRDKLIAHAVEANIHTSASQLRHGSAILERLIQEQRLLVVGAHYELDTGLIDFYLDR
jgi:carbonic anhydrase